MKVCVCILIIWVFNALQTHAQKISFTEKRSSFYNYVKGDEFEGLVFSEDFVFPFLSNQSGDKRFTPSIIDIEKAERLLVKNIKSVTIKQSKQGKDVGPIIHENLKKFARQYYGYYTEEGDKVIYISCLIKDDYPHIDKQIPNWLKGAVVVLNGGSNYWQVQANLNNSTLFGLEINSLDR
ncbi:MAG: hypothetical protein H7Y07_12590 [Pyrinomonadaceae bacterium]|nr:hypothetical protein [Sphingobacteriaceae bacterium]